MITGSQPCYRCGKPATMAVNLNANAAGGVASNMVPACEDCHPSPFTITQRENERLRELLSQCKTSLMALLLFVYPSQDWRKDSVVKDAEKLIRTLDS